LPRTLQPSVFGKEACSSPTVGSFVVRSLPLLLFLLLFLLLLLSFLAFVTVKNQSVV
jgi:hypothetical protein